MKIYIQDKYNKLDFLDLFSTPKNAPQVPLRSRSRGSIRESPPIPCQRRNSPTPTVPVSCDVPRRRLPGQTALIQVNSHRVFKISKISNPFEIHGAFFQQKEVRSVLNSTKGHDRFNKLHKTSVGWGSG